MGAGVVSLRWLRLMRLIGLMRWLGWLRLMRWLRWVGEKPDFEVRAMNKNEESDVTGLL